MSKLDKNTANKEGKIEVVAGTMANDERIYGTVNMPVVMQARRPTVHVAQKSAEISQVQFLDKTADVPIAVQHQVPMDQKVRVADAPQLQFIDQTVMNMHMNEKGRLWLDEIDRMVQKAQRCRDEGESGLENYCVTMRNRGQLKFKSETGDEENTKKAVRVTTRTCNERFPTSSTTSKAGSTQEED